ncbi:MAG: restriction endonuclease subunit S [Nitrospira sp.]
MKDGWQTKKLGDLYQIGSSKRVLKSQWKTEGVPFYRGREVTRLAADSFVDNELFISEEHFAELSKECGVPKAGDIVITAIGTIGNSHVVRDSDRFYFKDASVLWMKRTAEVSSEFVNLWLKAPSFCDQLDRGNGATVDTLTIQKLQSVELVVPPLPEQQRIVGILDEVFEGLVTAKANAEKNLHNAHALFDSHLQSVFTKRGDGWVEKRLEEIGTTQTGSTPKTSERNNYGDFIPFVKPADFKTDGSLDYENDGLTKKGLSEARKVAAGSVLMVCIGATIGKCGYCERDITTNQQINALTPFKNVSNKFVYYQMLTKDFQRRVILSSAQATLPIINKSKWSALTVVLPPKLEDQKRIAAKFESLCEETQRLESIYQQKLAALDALKKSLLHQAFSGQL